MRVYTSRSIPREKEDREKETHVKNTRPVSPYTQRRRVTERNEGREGEKEGKRGKKREEEKERTEEGRIYRKWCSIAAGKDAESGPQLQQPDVLLSFPRGASAAVTHIYSRFRNNNYLIPRARARYR